MTKVLADAIVIAGGNGRKVLDGVKFYSEAAEKNGTSFENNSKVGAALASSVKFGAGKTEDRSMGM